MLDDDIREAQRLIQERINGRGGASDPISRYGQEEDRRRQELIVALNQALADPTGRDTADRAARAQARNLTGLADREYQGADQQRLAGAARTGLLGSSASRFDAGSLSAVRDDARQQAAAIPVQSAQQYQDLEQQQLGQVLRQILAPVQEQQLLSQATIQGAQVGNQFSELQAQNEAQFRAALANALGGLVKNTVTPAISGGFQYADRQNQRQSNQYAENLTAWSGQPAESRGPQPQRPTNQATWWGW